MKQQNNGTIDRRAFVWALSVGASAVAAPAALATEAHADSEKNNEKLKTRYRADSDDVKAFYRVNRYPK